MCSTEMQTRVASTNTITGAHIEWLYFAKDLYCLANASEGVSGREAICEYGVKLDMRGFSPVLTAVLLSGFDMGGCDGLKYCLSGRRDMARRINAMRPVCNTTAVVFCGAG